MSDIPMDERACQQDAVQRLNKWLLALEERICVLLGSNDPDALKPGEREMAASRHLMMVLRLLQFRQQCARSGSGSDAAVLFEPLLREIENL